MKKRIIVLRIDPAKRNIARHCIERKPETIQRLLGTRTPKYEEVMRIEENPLVLTSRDQDKRVVAQEPAFRIKGYKTIHGKAYLSGLHAGRTCNCPVDLAWANRMIEWIDQ